MNKKVVQILIALLIGIVLIAASPLPDIDEGDGGGSKAYCVVTAKNPAEWGDSVRGYGKVTCTSTTGFITIVVELEDAQDPGNYSYDTRTCHNVTFCERAVYVDLKYHSGDYFQTRVSGYYPGNPPGTYDESPWIRVYYDD